ncbi:thiol:disulfide interchange protein DsbA/DsbL [Shewanella sp. Isolate11]|uniref:thiol:disulfide interchange protein DsbA/DsbL n=1 Tax=Shewanella sp. Isolate11 TaxID=2908530 RepID=UPI001EFC2EF2|nr:thiol:disulfide interchange protein DsbA/DsbL [Shewanella sp. Isolate11]MCG9696340.1 thiol:disulfide interchange protein DsbA/DsbL [Shewanella sp. Isolate11]
MKKITYVVRFMMVIFAGLFAVQVAAQAQFIEGRDYVKVAGIPEATKPVVREFFSYNCPHCYRQDGLFKATMEKLGDSVDFERTPVGAGRPSWQLSQEAYYLAQKFKVTEQAHGNLFKRIHEGQGAFTRKEELSQFFMAEGVPQSDVEKAMASADSQLALSNYDTQAELAGIRGVPTLLVNGKYMVTNKTRSPEELSALLKYLSTLE